MEPPLLPSTVVEEKVDLDSAGIVLEDGEDVDVGEEEDGYIADAEEQPPHDGTADWIMIERQPYVPATWYSIPRGTLSSMTSIHRYADVYLLIFALLSAKDLSRMACTDRRMRSISETDFLYAR